MLLWRCKTPLVGQSILVKKPTHRNDRDVWGKFSFENVVAAAPKSLLAMSRAAKLPNMNIRHATYRRRSELLVAGSIVNRLSPSAFRHVRRKKAA